MATGKEGEQQDRIDLNKHRVDLNNRRFGKQAARDAIARWGTGWGLLGDEQRDAFCAAEVLVLADAQDDAITWDHRRVLAIYTYARDAWRAGLD